MAVMVSLLVLLKGLIGRGHTMDWIIWIVAHYITTMGFALSIREMATNLFRGGLSVSAKLEIVAIVGFVLCLCARGLSEKYRGDLDWMWWFMAMAVGQYHAMNLNLIFHEIVSKDCGLFNAMIVIVPNAMLLFFEQSQQLFVLKLLSGVLMLCCAALWTVYSHRICLALRMDWWWSVPRKGNNPRRKLQ